MCYHGAIMRIYFALAALVASLVLSPASPAHATTTLQAGDLIRGESFSAVYYYGEDGFRYVFPNEHTYFSWYNDFSTVKWITDAELAAIQIGGNVTYKPGVKMIKVNTDPTVYAVGGQGTLFSIPSEDAAVTLYGDNWNRNIDDLPDSFFGNYTVPGLTTTDVEYSIDVLNAIMGPAYSISDNLDLSGSSLIRMYDMQFSDFVGESSTITIQAGQTVKFYNQDAVAHHIVSDTLSWGTGTLQPLDTYVKRFTDPGTYSFHCSLHPEMTGTIIVTE